MSTHPASLENVPPLPRVERDSLKLGRVQLSHIPDRARGIIRLATDYRHIHSLRRPGISGSPEVTVLTCKNCGYDHLDVHRTGDHIITYCQQCGTDTKAKREGRRDRWTEEKRQLRRDELHVVRAGKKKRRG